MICSTSIAVAQIGARRHYAVPSLLNQCGLLDALYTDVCADVGLLPHVARWLPRPLQPPPLRRLLARTVPGVPPDRIHAFNFFGLSRVLARSRARTQVNHFDAQAQANSRFCRLVARRGLGAADTLYAFNGAALELLQFARKHSIRTILDQTAAPVTVEQSLLADERQRWPGWDLGDTSPLDWAALAQREAAEWDLADTLICGSDYVRDCLHAQSPHLVPCRVVPYGAPALPPRPPAYAPGTGPLRVLYAGSVCLRKGIPYLMEAARRLQGQAVRFRAVGPIHVSRPAVHELRRWIDLVGSVPRPQMQREYQQAHVLVLPSISEGSANVCYEALAAGLPVITTPNAGSVVRDGLDGYIVPIRCDQSLADRIASLAEDRHRLAAMSAGALARAAQFNWADYARRLAAAVSPAAADARLPDQLLATTDVAVNR